MKVSVVIPAMTDRLDALRRSIDEQTVRPDQVEVVLRVRPNGRARNVGARRTDGDVLVFIDDDAVLGHPRTIENMLRPMRDDPDGTIGVTGASKLLPPDAPWFQRRVAYEIPRIEHPVVDRDVETNPSLDSYGFSELTTTCCAVRRSAFDAVGGFSEELVQAEDTEFFFRLRAAGYRFFLCADTWAYHPAPSSLGRLLRKYYQMGIGHAQEAKLNPERRVGLAFRPRWLAYVYLLVRTAILLPNVFVPYSFAHPHMGIGFKPIKALASYVNAWGYVRGYLCDAPHRFH